MCDQVLVDHRTIATWGLPVPRYECPLPDCAALPADHPAIVPCQWSEPVAFGWKYGEGLYGRRWTFPTVKCPGCRHVPRRGEPRALAQMASLDGVGRSYLR